MKALVLVAASALSSAAAPAAECPRAAFVAGASDEVPPIARLIVFWPRTKKPSQPKPVVELPAGVSLSFVLQKLSSDERWDAYSLTVVAEPKRPFRVDGAGPRRDFYADGHWRKPAKAAAYRLEWTEAGRARSVVLPAESSCFPWPKGAKAVALHADGSEAAP